jgi:hypothetical protein
MLSMRQERFMLFSRLNERRAIDFVVSIEVASTGCDIQRRPTGTPSRERRQMIHEIAYALVPFFFSMATGYLAGKLTRGGMPLSSINTMLVDYALPFALFLYTAKMQRSSLDSHFVLILLLVAVMLGPYFASLALSRYLFKAAPPNAAVRAVTIDMFGILFGLSYGVQDTPSGTTLIVSSVLSIVTLTETTFLLGYR